MSRQFPIVSSQYGAPMGRSGYGIPENLEPRSVRLFRVNLDSGGYDDGGAYWGTGSPLFCAVSDDGDYRQFTRACNRAHACLLLGLDRSVLKSGLRERLAWRRWSVTFEYYGAAKPCYVIREFGKFKVALESWSDVCFFARNEVQS